MTVKLQTRDLVEILHTEDPTRAPHLIRSPKKRTTDSEKRSLGYETMTTVSDLDSEVVAILFQFLLLWTGLMSAGGVVVQ